jgi:large subunit ribosomal protein L17
MRHRLKDQKLGRTTAHRKALMSALVCALIEQRRIRTTLAKAKSAGSLAERMVTIGREGTLSARRKALEVLRQRRCVQMLFDQVVPGCQGRQGGYTRIVRLGARRSDGSEMAILEWVDLSAVQRKKKTKKAAAGEADKA